MFHCREDVLSKHGLSIAGHNGHSDKVCGDTSTWPKLMMGLTTNANDHGGAPSVLLMFNNTINVGKIKFWRERKKKETEAEEGESESQVPAKASDWY